MDLVDPETPDDALTINPSQTVVRFAANRSSLKVNLVTVR